MTPYYEQYMKQLTQWLLSRETVNFASWEAEGNIEIRDHEVLLYSLRFEVICYKLEIH